MGPLVQMEKKSGNWPSNVVSGFDPLKVLADHRNMSGVGPSRFRLLRASLAHVDEAASLERRPRKLRPGSLPRRFVCLSSWPCLKNSKWEKGDLAREGRTLRSALALQVRLARDSPFSRNVFEE